HNVPGLMQGERCNRLRMHPDDAARLRVGDGDTVTVRSRVGAIAVAVRLTDEVMPGVLCLPHGWGHHATTNRRGASPAPGPGLHLLVRPPAVEPPAAVG